MEALEEASLEDLTSIPDIGEIIGKNNTQSFPKLHFYDFLASNFYFRKC